MVQSMFAPDTVDDMDKLWTEAAPGDLMDSKLKCVFEEQPSTPEEPPVVEASSMEVEKEPENPKAELRLLMEECKRLQAENSKVKQLYDEVKCQASGPSSGVEDIMNVVSTHLLIVMILLSFIFGFGVLLGVSL